jgi:hypothetical protein
MAWGRNVDGQLGNGSRENSAVPEVVPGLSGVKAVAASYGVSMALMSDGTVMDWGENEYGQLGDGTTNEYTPTPVKVEGLSEVVAISAGGGGGLALLKNGTVMSWGATDTPVPVPGLSKVTAIASDGGHSLALLDDGEVMAWGENEYGELGDGSMQNSKVPVKVFGLREAVAIADGASHNLALLSDGTVVSWGQDDWGQLGTGEVTGPETCGPTSCSLVPVPVSGLGGVVGIATGYGQDLALSSDGSVSSWGENFLGQLGNGSGEGGSDLPLKVSTLSGVSAIAAGDNFSMALLNGESGLVAGKVTSVTSGQPVQGARVCTLDVNDTPAGCSTTDSNGLYEVSVRTGGAYKVRVSGPLGGEYVDGQYYGGSFSSAEASPVTITLGATTPGVNVQLSESGSIAGKVVDSARGVALEGIEVCALETRAECASTNSKGEYAISGLPTGRYPVEFSVPNGMYHTQYWEAKSLEGQAEKAAVSAGQTTEKINASLEPLEGAITGTVRDASAPMENAEVCAHEVSAGGPEGSASRCTYTNSLGQYKIRELTGNEYIVAFSPSYSIIQNYTAQFYDGSYSLLDAQVVRVTLGEDTPNIDAELVEGGYITGTVTSAAGNTPVGDIEVCFWTRSEELVGCTVTDAKGSYRTPLIPRGEYKVEFTSPFGSSLNYAPQYYDGVLRWQEAQWVEVLPRQTRSGVNASMHEGTSISGRVTDAWTKAPLAEVLVCAIGQQEIAACALTTSAGAYKIQGLADSEYLVSFLAGEPYLPQYYEGAESPTQAQVVSVAVGAPRTGVNAILQRQGGAAPAKLTSPEVSGSPEARHVLTCSPGSWTGAPTPTFSYRWLRDGSPLSGAMSAGYTVQAADEGHALTCEVTASNALGSSSASSAGVHVPIALRTIPTSPIVEATVQDQPKPEQEPSPEAPQPTVTPASKGTVKVEVSRVVVSHHAVRVRIACPQEGFDGSIELVATVRRRESGHWRRVKAVLAKGRVQDAGDAQLVVPLPLTPIGRKALDEARSHHVTATVVLLADKREVATATVTVT